MWELTAVSALGLAAIGVGMAARLERDPERRMPPWARVATTAGALAIALIQVPGLVSEARTRDSGEALAAGHVDEARELASEAIDAAPWAASPYENRAAVEARDADYDAARADVSEAIDREPDNWRHRLALVQVELADGRRADAEAAFRDLLDLSLTSEVPYKDATALGRDPAIRAATRDGCLAYRFGSCGYGEPRPSAPVQPRCLESDAAAAAIRDVRGVALANLQVVRVPVLNADPIFYAAGEANGTLTTWALDLRAYRTGIGNVVPLDDAARAATTLGPPVDPAVFDLSASDDGAVDARACVHRSTG
jgi:tetratricopeptide (TPR) repeat protein